MKIRIRLIASAVQVLFTLSMDNLSLLLSYAYSLLDKQENRA